MGAPLTPTAPFATVELLGAYLAEDLAGNPLATAALAGATALIQSYCDQTIALVLDDVVKLDGSGSDVMLLPEIPVLDVSEVIENYDLDSPETLTPPGNGSSTGYDWSVSGLLYRRRGRMQLTGFGAKFGTWPNRRRSVQVTYTHGYDVTGTTVVGRALAVVGAGIGVHIAVDGFNDATDTLLTVVDETADAAVDATADGTGITVTTSTTGHTLLVTWNTPVPTLPADLQMVTVAVAARGLAQDGATQETTGAYTALYAGQPGTLTKDEMRVCDRYRTRRK